jgi:tripartite-type tricarboxylate transporter receptor subunit TctC
MKRSFVLLALVAMLALVVSACAPDAAAPPAEPTPGDVAGIQATPEAPATPTAPDPAETPVAPAAPTKVNGWPERPISMVVPFAAGGSTDVSARMLAPELERILGVPVQIVNRPGGGSQVGNTEVATARPDGYTAGYPAFPTLFTSYLDPDRQAVYDRDSFEPVARTTVNTIAFVVRADSPFQNMDDLVEAARADPEGISIASSGLMSVNHMPVLRLQQLADVEFAVVHFDGSAPGIIAMLGGHVDVASVLEPEVVGQVRAGEVRVLGVADTEPSTVLDGAPTMAEQGYDLVFQSTHSVIMPAGTPMEIVEAFSEAIREAMEQEDLRTRMEEVGLLPRHLTPQEFSEWWEEQEAVVASLMEEVRQ